MSRSSRESRGRVFPCIPMPYTAQRGLLQPLPRGEKEPPRDHRGAGQERASVINLRWLSVECIMGKHLCQHEAQFHQNLNSFLHEAISRDPLRVTGPVRRINPGYSGSPGVAMISGPIFGLGLKAIEKSSTADRSPLEKGDYTRSFRQACRTPISPSRPWTGLRSMEKS